MSWRKESPEVLEARENVSYWAKEKQKAKGSGDRDRLEAAKKEHKKAKDALKEAENASV